MLTEKVASFLDFAFLLFCLMISICFNLVPFTSPFSNPLRHPDLCSILGIGGFCTHFQDFNFFDTWVLMLRSSVHYGHCFALTMTSLWGLDHLDVVSTETILLIQNSLVSSTPASSQEGLPGDGPGKLTLEAK